jgi:hypothetical protein
MVVNQNKKIRFTLQLVKSDGKTVETDADVSYQIISTTGSISTVIVSSRTATYNSTTKSYLDTLDPSVDWTNQEVGSYLVVWSVSNTEDDFLDTYTEELEISIEEDKIDRILGLVHQNMLIDNATYDTHGNLVAARLRIYYDSASVGSSNNVIASYEIEADAQTVGQFTTWKQIEG